MTEESYKQFDKDPIVDSSDVVIKGFRVRVRDLALGCSVIVCLVVIVVLAALLGSAHSENNSPAASTGAQTGGGGGCEDQCFSPACFQTAAHVTQLLNASASPCQDFHAFACGNFPARNPLLPTDGEITSGFLIHNQNWDRLHRLLQQKSNVTDSNHYEYKLRTFFESCNDFYAKTQRQGRPFIEWIVSPSGGWWVLQGDAAWNAQPYDFHKQLRMIHVDFWTDVFFGFSLTTDWLDWHKTVIQIDFAGVGLNYMYYHHSLLQRYVDDYKKFVRTVGSLLLRDSGTVMSDDEKKYRLDTFVTDVIYAETTLSSLMLQSSSAEDPFNHSNRLPLSTINSHAKGAVDFVGIFSYMFSSAGVTGDTRVVVLEPEYINLTMAWIDQLPASNKSRILNNYMIWRVAHKYAQDLSWDYVHANRELYVALTYQRDFQGTWTYCVNKLDTGMREGLSALFIKNHFGEENRRTASEIATYVKMAMVESMGNSMHWMSEDTRKIAIQKLEETVFKMGYPDYMLNESILNQLYSVVSITPDDYLGNLMNMNKLFRYDWNKRLTRSIETARQEVWAYPTYSHIAEYYNPWRELIVPAGMLQFPLYDHASPQYVNFGSLGSILGKQLTHAVDQIGNSFLLNGSHYGTWWSNATTTAYQAVKNCTIDAFKDLKNGPYQLPGYRDPQYVKVPAVQYAPTALADATGVKLAFQAYQKWAATKGSEKQFPGGAYSNNQLFFINYAQTFCFNRNPLEGMDKAQRGTWVQENLRINAALAQVQAFQDAFHCKPAEPMVAPKRCDLY